ncbi:MAG: hypothetical protein PHV82_14085 [Victivallaceae bacterium]|nr:hypothetical protein [Victivallaceae bacterium]
MLSKLLISMAIFCCSIYAHAFDLNNSELVSRMQEVGDQLAAAVSSIDNEFSARQALPQLETLSAEFRRLRAEFSNRQQADPTNVIRFTTDVAVTMNKLKSALLKLKANEDIPFELREKITNLIHISLKADYS